MSKSVKIYATSTCPYCSRLKAFLTGKSIPFEVYDIGVDSRRRKEMIEKSGQKGTPVVDIDGKIIVGFDKDEISKELEK
jgi:glutaredoxin-like YruB-family protein